MEPIKLLIRITHRPDGGFDAFCENLPETVVSGESHEDAAEKVADATLSLIRGHDESEEAMTESEAEFLDKAFRISQKHKGDPGEWLPMIFDEEGVRLGEPIGAPKVVSVQFSTSTGPIPGRTSEPAVRELRAVAV